MAWGGLGQGLSALWLPEDLLLPVPTPPLPRRLCNH